jgi:hypothetical protein
MKTTDLIRINVTGTNGSTRKQSTISRVFDGAGNKLTDQGQVDGSSNEKLVNLPGDGASSLPPFPADEFQKALAAGDVESVKKIQLAYAERVAEFEAQSGGGNESLQLAKAVLEYAKKYHNFHEEDGNHFVMKLENLDVSKMTLKDQRTMYTVQGTAVFGGR